MGLCVQVPDNTGSRVLACTHYPATLFYKAVFWRLSYISADHVLSVLSLLVVGVVAFALYSPSGSPVFPKLAPLWKVPLLRRAWSALITMGVVLYIHEGAWFLVAGLFYPVNNVVYFYGYPTYPGLNDVMAPLCLIYVLYRFGARRGQHFIDLRSAVLVGCSTATAYVVWMALGFHVSFIANNPVILNDITPYFKDALTQVLEIGSWWAACGSAIVALWLNFRDASK